jgi:hypothetical protein
MWNSRKGWQLSSRKECGAPEESNLETAPIFSILEQLEEWAGLLKTLPEATSREFEAAARGREETEVPPAAVPPRRVGPRMPGPRR